MLRNLGFVKNRAVSSETIIFAHVIFNKNRNKRIK